MLFGTRFWQPVTDYGDREIVLLPDLFQCQGGQSSEVQRRPTTACEWATYFTDVINVYNVYKKILCKRVYYFVNVYLNERNEAKL